MDCAAVKPRMEALVSGSLPPSERELAEQHIAMCEGCRLELELVRAVGSQEKPATAAKEDWTLDRIFGPEGAAGGAPGTGVASDPASRSPSADAESIEIAPISDSPPGGDARDPHTVFPSDPADPPAAPEPAFGATAENAEPDPLGSAAPKKVNLEASWNFEPADVTSDVKPPEESLFFAAEALNRSKPGSRKKSGARAILWGAGGLVGIALLVFSAWLVVHMGSSTPEIPATNVPAPAPDAHEGTTEGTPEATPGPNDVQQTPTDGGVPAPSIPVPPDNSVQGSPTSQAPRTSASSAAPQPMPLTTQGTTPAPAPTKAPRATKTTPPPSRTGGAAQEHHVSAPSQGSSPRITRVIDQTGLTDSHAPATETTRGSQAPSQTRRAPTPPPDEDESSATPAVGEDDTSNDDSASSSQAKTGTGQQTARPSGGRGSSIWSSTTGSQRSGTPPKTEEAPPPPPPVNPDAPIEKLHLATVDASERGDLEALRRLRTAWKSFMAKIVGPDRARAKREYADCLWAIQLQTGRKADQKDALAAYREYLLSAPAGGADSRTVSRLRQLEDALTEHR